MAQDCLLQCRTWRPADGILMYFEVHFILFLTPDRDRLKQLYFHIRNSQVCHERISCRTSKLHILFSAHYRWLQTVTLNTGKRFRIVWSEHGCTHWYMAWPWWLNCFLHNSWKLSQWSVRQWKYGQCVIIHCHCGRSCADTLWMKTSNICDNFISIF